MSLFISTTTPSDSFKESKLEVAITQMAVKLAKARNQKILPQGPSLDINFLVAGELDKPDFVGMRMGYDDEGSTLYFERAVPVELVESSDAEEFVKLVLEDVIANASDFFQEQKMEFDLLSWQTALMFLNESAGKNVTLN